MQRPTLYALEKDIEPEVYKMDTDVCTIGRADMCHVVVNRQTISRVHATIERDGPRYMLHDANSINGTYVNGHRIQEPYLLKNYDLIGLSKPVALLRFEDPDPTMILPGQLHYDEQKMLFILNQKPIDLSPTQFRLLNHLFQNAGQVCTRESCAWAIWNREYDSDIDSDALDRAVSNLRRELRNADPGNQMLRTRRGLGYILIL